MIVCLLWNNHPARPITVVTAFFFLVSPWIFHLPLHNTNKLALVSPNGEQYDSLLRQLRDRMEEGCGETIYVVGMGSGSKTQLFHSLSANV